MAPPTAAPIASTVPPSSEEIALAEHNVHANTKDAQLRLVLADIYVRAGKLPEAASDLRILARIHPDNIEAQRRLASIYHDAGYTDREYECLRAIVARAPHDWRAGIRMAEIALEVGWMDIAEPLLAAAARDAPEEPRLYIGKASCNFRRHQWAEMEKNAREGLKFARDNVALWVVLSEACRLQKRLPEAEQALRTAITHTNDHAGLTRQYAKLAHLLLEPGWRMARAREAEQTAQLALQGAENDLEARYWLARAQEFQGHIPDAEGNYAMAAKEDLQFESLTFFLGRIYQRSHNAVRRAEGERLLSLYQIELDNSEAYDHAAQQVQKRPGDPAVHVNMARWYLKTGRTPLAILELRRVLELKRNEPNARNLLRLALKAEGRISEAKQL